MRSSVVAATLVLSMLICSNVSGQMNPAVKLLTNGGDWYKDTVRVYGTVSDQSITSAGVEVRNGGFVLDTTVVVSSGVLSALVRLAEGSDTIKVSVTKSSVTTTSSGVVFRYHGDHTTNIVIKYDISGRGVTLDASSSTNADGLPVTYAWQPDPSNPSVVTLANANSAITSYTSPVIDGEYYFTVTATTSLDTSWARAVVVADSGLAHTVDMGTWHPGWVDSAVVYEIYVASFSSSEGLPGITAAIPRLKALGIKCIWLTPIMPSVSTHGYNITDYYNVRPTFGTKSDLTELVNTAHQHGIKVILDLVINHTSAVHPFIMDAFAYGKYSPYNDFYEWHNGVVASSTYIYYYGWSDLANINFQSTWTKEYLLRMAKYWVEKFDIDGYRCDVAWGVNDGGVNQWGETEGRPGGAAFWQRFRSELKAIKPDIYLLGEMDATHYDVPALYFDRKFDSGYDWSFLSTLTDCLQHTSSVSSLDALVEQLYGSPNYPSYARPFRFIENHDLNRFISQYNLQQTKMAASMILTIPGVPLIYAGQEVGERTMRGLIDWSDPNNLLPYYTQLVHIRKDNPALQQGSFMRLGTSAGESVYAYLRKAGENKVVVINNFYGTTISVVVHIPADSINLDSTKTWYANDLLNGGTTQIIPSSLYNYQTLLTPFSSKIIAFTNSPATGIAETSSSPQIFNLEQNFPNPFNPTTKINYSIPQDGFVALKVFNVLGQEVATLFAGEQSAGMHWTTFDGHSLAGGIYFARLHAGQFLSTKKMLLMK